MLRITLIEMNNDYILGEFISEEKNRFLCRVLVNDLEEECYIPSSCRLENFISLSGKTVLLRENKSNKGRTRYSVYALVKGKTSIILRPAEANVIVQSALNEHKFSFVDENSSIAKECVISGYKTDFYIQEEKTIIEVKSIITLNKNAVFPTVHSDRAIVQLKKLLRLQNEGFNVVYVFISLNPTVKDVSISNSQYHDEYRKLFIRCINNGMKCKAYTAELNNGIPTIKREIPLMIKEI